MDDTCKICHKQAARYTCPRCNVRYCSIACYRCPDHESCSEQFYKQCFMEGLQDMQTSGEEKQKVLEMLQRLETENPELDSDDDSEDELEERLEGLDLDHDTDAIWSRLTADEKTEFRKMLGDGRLGNMVELWEPWWKIKDPSKVEEVGMTSSSSITHPTIHHAPDFTTLTKGAPSKCLVNDVINILYGYAYVTRLHNGSHGDTPLQALKEVTSLSGALGKDSFTDVPSALHACIHALQQEAKKSYVSRDFSVAVITDVKDIISGPHQRAPLTYVMAALSDLHQLSRSARKVIDKDVKKLSPAMSERRSNLEAQKKRWFLVKKKLEYLLSWSHKFGLQLQDTIPNIELEFCALSTEMVLHKEDKERLETAWGGTRPPQMRRFIEEITDR